MRVAVKIGYIGSRFHGSQIQPGVRTVHGALARALASMGHEDPRILWAGRTDSGVSAAGNVAVFETHVAPPSLLIGLSNAMEDAWTWAWAEVSPEFEPRHARRRSYRYMLHTRASAEAIGAALSIFEGTHDFTGFARLDPDTNPERTVFSTSATREGQHVIIDVEGENFLWNQVRRMVEAARRIAEGTTPRAEVVAALAQGSKSDFGTADPEPLMLLDVTYGNVTFLRSEEPKRVVRRLDDTLEMATRDLTMLRTMRALAASSAEVG